MDAPSMQQQQMGGSGVDARALQWQQQQELQAKLLAGLNPQQLASLQAMPKVGNQRIFCLTAK